MKRTVNILFLGFLLFFCTSSTPYRDYMRQRGQKIIPESLRPVAMEALAAYPELDSVFITFDFKEKFDNSFMQAQPEIANILRRNGKRKFIIRMAPTMVINNDTVQVHQVPHDVLLGWFAHELGHILDYQGRNAAEMVWFGLQYLWSEDFQIEVETTADVYAIRRGFANEIIATKNFILENSSLPKWYKEKIASLYLSTDQVLKIVDEMQEELVKKQPEPEEQPKIERAGTP